jgi:hypothetical protein
MLTTKCKKFKGEIENYLRIGQHDFDVKMDRAFSSLKIRTLLCQSNILKRDGYSAAHLLLVVTMLPVLRLKSINGFCKKCWSQWSTARKDTFYRFKDKPYRWRSFFYKVINELAQQLSFDKDPLQDRYFIIDDSVIPKRGRAIENVSFVHDHCSGRSVLGFCVVALGLFTGNGFYPVDFSYWFSDKRHPKSPDESIGDPRSISGRMSYEAKHCTKIDLALEMIQRAVSHGLRAGYVLFDSWYAWPSFINKIRQISQDLHVICRLKDIMTQYEYRGKKYRLSQLYQHVKKDLRKSRRTGLLLKRVTVRIPGTSERAAIVFARGYCEPQEHTVKGTKKAKSPPWVAFLSTDTRLHAATIIKKYTKRWSVEVFFKESKQLLGLGKEHSNSFQAQVFATTNSFLRYALLNYLNEREYKTGTGPLFETLADETATVTYALRLWDFLRGLFEISFSKIFELFQIEDDFQSYLSVLNQALSESTPFRGCET